MEKHGTRHSHLREELNAITNETDPIAKFDRIKSFFERHHPAAPAKRPASLHANDVKPRL